MPNITNEMRKAIKNLTNRYISLVKADLPLRWNSLRVDLTEKEIYEVLSGLLARQMTLAIQFVQNPNCWTFDLAPIILRSMADNYINFSWISKAPLDRSRKFIYYGLGQEKLILEHRKNQMLKDGINPEEDIMTKVVEEWINGERYTFLTEVNLGAWSGINTRQMAEEAGCLDFYNYVYAPFSTVSHNMWGHIAKYNLIVSNNPLHKKLKKPVIGNFHIDFHNIKLAAKYLDKMIREFNSVFGLEITGETSYEQFLSDFSRFETDYLQSVDNEA